MLLSRQFLLLYLMNALSFISGYFAVNNFKSYAIQNGLSNETYLAWVGSIASIFNALRFTWSTATDYYSYRVVYAVLLVLQIIFNFTVKLVSHSPGAYAVWVCLLLCCEGGHFSLAPNVLKKIFGDDSGIALYGIFFSFTGVMSMVIILLQMAILTEDASGYNIFFYMNGLFSCLALIILILFFNEKRWNSHTTTD